VAKLRVWKGEANEVDAGFDRDLYFTLPKGQADKLKAVLESQQPLVAPVNAGQRVGTMKIALDGKPLSDVPVVAIKSVGLGNVFARGWDALRLFFQ
jgi:D-alanyl-D-alanine carboxypeptidase (penicillin-binding protein 5/6)